MLTQIEFAKAVYLNTKTNRSSSENKELTDLMEDMDTEELVEFIDTCNAVISNVGLDSMSDPSDFDLDEDSMDLNLCLDDVDSLENEFGFHSITEDDWDEHDNEDDPSWLSSLDEDHWYD